MLQFSSLTIDSSSEFDQTGDSLIDTVLTLSSGGTIVLSDLTGVTDLNELF